MAIMSGFQPEDVVSITTTCSNSSTRLGAILGKCGIESKSQIYTAILSIAVIALKARSIL